MKKHIGDHAFCRQGNPGKQNGIADVLIALLVGLGLTASVVGTAAYIRSTQEQSMTAHGQMQAQMKAWTGVEIVRQYLYQIQTNGKAADLALAISNAKDRVLTLNLQQVSGIEAKLTAVDSTTAPTTFTAQIVGITAAGTRAESRSTIEIVFNTVAAVNPSIAPLIFNRNLKLGGHINVMRPASSTAPIIINVIGDISTGGNSITGVDVLNATGSINITSGSSFSQLNSNCDVALSGSVSAVNINALRNICMTGNASASGSALANGSILAEAANGANGTLSAVTNPTGVSACLASGAGGTGTTASTCLTPLISGVNLSGGNSGAKTVNTYGSVNMQSGSIGTLRARGNLNVSGNGSVTTGTIGGTLTKPGWNNNVNITANSGYSVNITPASPVAIPTSTFNAYDLQSLANYVFKFDATGYPKVMVQNVNGIADGTYYLGGYPGGNKKDYLCTSLSPTSTADVPICQGSANFGTKICQGYSDYNSCFSYPLINGKKSWAIATSQSMAPGITWFEGDLNVGVGNYYNTFIATGNIVTSGQHATYAPNFAGYSGSVNGTQYAPTGICANSYFPNLYPTQFCTLSSQTFNADASGGIGNYAFMAGSWSGSAYSGQSSYLGGNITIGASSKVRGNVKAGNEFSSGGSTTISGSVAALALGSLVQNSMGGSTTFDLTQLPSTFTIAGGTSSSTPVPQSVRVKWARYL
ncbi:MAG: hypothetical protein H7327_08930 [Herminiimonas sp.]|nr:hypothetical protein [Herminiimonas sp.]